MCCSKYLKGQSQHTLKNMMGVYSGKSIITYCTHNFKVKIFFKDILLSEYALIIIFPLLN